MDAMKQLKEYLRNTQYSAEEKVKQILESKEQFSVLSSLLARQSDFDENDLTLQVRIVAIAEENGAVPAIAVESLRELMSDLGAVEAREDGFGEFIITFNSAVGAQLAFYTYNELELPELGIRLLAARRASNVAKASNELSIGKFTRRYDVNIANDRLFEVSKRIIGTQGCNMKAILASVQAETGCREKELKMRLRGRGSNFQEGPERRECNDKLHLCVSAKTRKVFDVACTHVEALLNRIFDEYVSFLKRARDTETSYEQFRFQRVEQK